LLFDVRRCTRHVVVHVQTELFFRHTGGAVDDGHRRRQALPVRALREDLHGPEQPAAPHPVDTRRRALAHVPGVQQDVRDVERPEAAPAHPQLREAVPVRGVSEGVHAILEPMPT